MSTLTFETEINTQDFGIFAIVLNYVEQTDFSISHVWVVDAANLLAFSPDFPSFLFSPLPLLGKKMEDGDNE